MIGIPAGAVGAVLMRRAFTKNFHGNVDLPGSGKCSADFLWLFGLPCTDAFGAGI